MNQDKLITNSNSDKDVIIPVWLVLLPSVLMLIGILIFRQDLLDDLNGTERMFWSSTSCLLAQFLILIFTLILLGSVRKKITTAKVKSDLLLIKPKWFGEINLGIRRIIAVIQLLFFIATLFIVVFGFLDLYITGDHILEFASVASIGWTSPYILIWTSSLIRKIYVWINEGFKEK